MAGKIGSAYGIRTRVPAVRGLCPRPLDERAVFAKGCYSIAIKVKVATAFYRRFSISSSELPGIRRISSISTLGRMRFCFMADSFR